MAVLTSKPMKRAGKIDPSRIRQDWQVLCGEIGELRAGGVGGRRAADYIARSMTESGCSGARLETFPCVSLRAGRVRISVQAGKRRQKVESTVLIGSPGTPPGRPLNCELVWLEMPESTRRLKPGSLRGRVVALFWPMPMEMDLHRRLMAAAPALARRAERVLAAGGVDVALKQEVSPFFDNFPFNWAGVPSLLFYRPNFAGGRWQHHGQHDTLENVSVEEVVRLLRGLTPLLENLAAEPRWSFPLGLPARQRSVARQLGRELFGLRA